MEKVIPKIEREMKKIVVPGEGGETAFAYPAVGPATYQNVGKEILSKGQMVPTGEQMASLVHVAYCNPKMENEPEFRSIRGMMRNDWLWIFNRNLWTPKGVYVVQDLEAIGSSQQLNQSDLEKTLKDGKDVNGIRFSRDKSVRFAPKGSYQLGKNTPESLVKDGFLIASYDLEGAEKLGKVSAKFAFSPRIFGIDVQEGQNSEQRVSSLGDYTDIFGGLYVYGNGFVDSLGGHAFGVLKDAKGIVSKK